MPPLPDPQHEAFCQHRAGGKTLDEAYKLAGFKPDRSHASRLAAKGPVTARISELQAETAEQFALTRADLLKRLERYIEVDPRKFYNERGELIPIHELPEDVAKCLTGIDLTVLDTGAVKAKKLRFVNPLDAIDKYSVIAGHRRPDQLNLATTLEQLVMQSLNVTVNVTVGAPENARPAQRTIEHQPVRKIRLRRPGA